MQISNSEKGEIIHQSKTKLKQGKNSISTDFTIANPKLWWPKGLGDQFLYQFNFKIQTNQATDNHNLKIGLRTIELVQEPDSTGSSFYFSVNGTPVFMKGANYIPQDNFLSRVSDEKYLETIQSAVDANMNMLRVWGGGVYEKDIFYNLCDEKGILVWQDFMFACNMYPGDEEFIENVKQEASQQIKRLRNHPCIAIWCGNNEVDEGWHNWGWQKALNYSKEDSTEVWNNYLKIFEDVLPSTIITYSPYIPYVPSSPKIGWGHEEALTQGDMHYWGVWWGEEPFGVYEEKVGRFMTEFGFQGFPNLQTLDSCLLKDDLSLSSVALQNHQKHPRGMELIQTYMEREYKVPENFDHYTYVSQLLQAYGIKKALEAHRRAKPYCMGTLYWQLNDCWPVISWSSVDYYNRWKALHYFARDTFKDYLISFEERNDSLFVFVASDKLETIKADLDLKILDFKGEEQWTNSQIVEIGANSSNTYFMKKISRFSKKDCLFTASLLSEGNELASNKYYFLPTKYLNLPEPKIEKKIVETEGGFRIILSSGHLAKNVFLSIDKDGFFSDNYFDLLPGEEKQVNFISKCDYDYLKNNLKVISLIDTY
ncbi:MAG: glycoside hydrolase family 2 protein [Bacteroidales bacterium]